MSKLGSPPSAYSKENSDQKRSDPRAAHQNQQLTYIRSAGQSTFKDSLIQSSIQTEEDKLKRQKSKFRRYLRDVISFKKNTHKTDANGNQYIDLKAIEKNKRMQKKLLKYNSSHMQKSSEYQSAIIYLKDDFQPKANHASQN